MGLNVVQRPKSPYLTIRGSIRGCRYEESTGTRDWKLAEEIRIRRENEILNDAIHGRAASRTFAEAVISYLDNGGSKRFLEPIIKEIGRKQLARIDQDAIDALARKLYPDASPATRIRQCYSPVSAVMVHAAKRKWCDRFIIERPQVNDPQTDVRTPEEAERLIAACSDHLRPLVIFLFLTGARVGEALWLDWKQVDLRKGHVSILKTKNGDARGVPLHPRVVAALANLPGNREDEVFRRPDGLPYARPRSDEDHSAGTRIKTGFRAACRRAGIKNFHPHGCRHTFATWHYAANRDLTQLMEIGGWRDVKSVMRYVHANTDQHRDSIHKLLGGKLGETVSMKAKSA